MSKFIAIAALFVLLAVATVVAAAMWLQAGDVEMSIHGIIALVAGVVVALALGVGLMALVFYSSRHGHDDQAGH